MSKDIQLELTENIVILLGKLSTKKIEFNFYLISIFFLQLYDIKKIDVYLFKFLAQN